MTAKPGSYLKGQGPQNITGSSSSSNTTLNGTGGGGRPNTAGGMDPSLKEQQKKETFRILKEMSDLLNTGLDVQSLGLAVRLCEEGTNPVALANFIKDWREAK